VPADAREAHSRQPCVCSSSTPAVASRQKRSGQGCFFAGCFLDEELDDATKPSAAPSRRPHWPSARRMVGANRRRWTGWPVHRPQLEFTVGPSVPCHPPPPCLPYRHLSRSDRPRMPCCYLMNLLVAQTPYLTSVLCMWG